ncbi:uncharacterized protein C1orf127 homolog isoform X2 [Sarcophilus harrisii]|uniref:uncharacterized protein C1orf127 homolog isoform X2 n=1 Tax=Sarcophilus harrisii TaxID=9305 RepID=UPI001301C126|nr:uncharacterized protein C1orf127 homolog isoform X2 [Sarcophilus harrisii]
MKSPSATVWVICLTCALPGVLPVKSKEDRPDQVVEISADDIECFSDYMALWIPKSHVHGLKHWLSRTLHMPVNWGSLEWLNSFLARCGYFLHPDSAGNYIFQVRYTACFVQQEEANYLLEIRIFQKGINRFGQSDRYILKCPVITSRLGQKSILCGPDTIQVSRPMPQGNASRQSPWLLSLRGELVALLEDASLLGLYVEVNSTTITILGSRQQLLQRKEVLNTSVDFLSLWMVSGYYAYSLEAMCPLVSSQPGPEVSIQIPKQGLGLVKRGFRNTEALTLRDLRVIQSNSFTVTENRDFVVVSIPASSVLHSQCQEAQEVPRMQSFYRVDLSLEFAEVAHPVHWTVENFFHCSALKEQPSASGMMDPGSFLAEVGPSVSTHLSPYFVPPAGELESNLPPSSAILTIGPSPLPSSPALSPSTPSVGAQLASSFSLPAAGSAPSDGLQNETWGSFAWDSRRPDGAVGSTPKPRLRPGIFSDTPEESTIPASSRSPLGLGCLSNPTAPSNSASSTTGARTSALVSFQENSGSPRSLQSTTPLPGLWLHSRAPNNHKMRSLGVLMSVPPDRGSPKSKKPPEATEKITKDVSEAIVPEPSDADPQGPTFLQVSTTLATGQNDSPRRHPGSRGTSALLSKNSSDGVIHPISSLTTLSPKKKQELIMKSQALSVGIGRDSSTSGNPGAVMDQQDTEDLTKEVVAQLPPSVMLQDESLSPSAATGAVPVPVSSGSSAGQLFSGPATALALPQLVSFRSAKGVQFQKAFTTQTDRYRETRPGQDLPQLPGHSNQLRRLMEGSRAEADMKLQRERSRISDLQDGDHLASKFLATTIAGGKTDARHGHNRTREGPGLRGTHFFMSEITEMTQRDPQFLQNRPEGVLVTNLPPSASEEVSWPVLQAESQSNSPLSWRNVAHTNGGRILNTLFPEDIVSESSITYQKQPKTDRPASSLGHELRSQQAFGQAATQPFLVLSRLLPEKQLADPRKKALNGITGSTLASSKVTGEQLSGSSEAVRTEDPGSSPAGTPSLWPSWTLHPGVYLSQATEVASPSISDPTEPGGPFPTGH